MSESRQTAQLEEMLERWHERYQQGHDAPATEFCLDTPELLPALQQQIDNVRRMERWVRRVDAQVIAPSGMAHGHDDPELLATLGLERLLAPPLAPGELGCLGTFRVQKVLGVGGMGVVFQAFDSQLDRLLALKVIRADVNHGPEAARRFLREARAAAAVHNDHVVPIYYVGEQRGAPFLVMPLLPGETLDRRLEREPRSPPELILQVSRETAAGLAAAHERGVIHRDVKPTNLWLEARGDGPLRVQLFDFGLSRFADSATSLTPQGQPLGTPAYMAPEQARGEAADSRADLFSLGCVLYRMAVGKSPFSRDTPAATLLAVLNEEPPAPATLRPELPTALSELILWLLRKNPAERPPSATQVVQVTEAVANGQPLRGLPRPGKLRAGHALVAATLLGLVVLAIAVKERMTTVPAGLGSGEPERPRPPAVELVGVRDLKVMHIRNVDLKLDQPVGELGRVSFMPQLLDSVEIEAALTRPAYAYLIAFRPDGSCELCFPRQEQEPPPLEERPRYPHHEKGVNYGLEEGAGLHAFMVLASGRPLPPYATAKAAIEARWKESLKAGLVRGGAPEVTEEVVWDFDGAYWHPWTAARPKGRFGRERGTGRKVQEPTALTALGTWLRQRHGIDTVAGVAFQVVPRK